MNWIKEALSINQPSPNRLATFDIRGIDFALFACALVLLSSLLSAAGFNLYELLGNTDTDSLDPENFPILKSVLGGYGLQLGLLVSYYVLCHYARSREPMGARIGFAPAIVVGFSGLVISWAILFVVSPSWEWVLEKLGLDVEFQQSVMMAIGEGLPHEKALLFALICLVAPICEELVFRAGIYRFLHQRVPESLALLSSAALFAFIHWNLYSFVPLMLLGLILALLYRNTGNIVSSIALHAFFNSLNLAIIVNFPDAIAK